MKIFNRVAYIPAVMIVCAGVTGCFSYHKTVEPASTPAIVETVPAPATSSSTTTTTSTDNGLVQKQKTTTYSVNP